MELLQINSIDKSYASGAKAVDHLSLKVGRGEILALVGASGCGKTTALRLIAGFETPDTGTITLDNRIVSGPSTFISPEKRGIGLLFQDYALFPHLTVEKNVGFGLRGISPERRKARIREMLVLGGIEEYSARYPHQLSGGQQQRVALARALAPSPSLVLLDEPFSNIDTLVKEQVRADLQHLFRQTGVTAIMVTHDIADAFAIADRVAVMREGRIEQIGTPTEIYQNPTSEYVANFFGRCNLISAEAKEQGYFTPFGQVTCAKNERPVPNALLLYRPEELVLNASSVGNAVVESVSFLGTSYEVAVSSGLHRLWVHANDGHRFKAGEKVQVTLKEKTPYAVPLEGASLGANS